MSTTSPIRECVRGHGPLEGLAETYGLPVAKGPAAVRGDFTHADEKGLMLPVKVWRCPTCSYLELSNLKP